MLMSFSDSVSPPVILKRDLSEHMHSPRVTPDALYSTLGVDFEKSVPEFRKVPCPNPHLDIAKFYLVLDRLMSCLDAAKRGLSKESLQELLLDFPDDIAEYINENINSLTIDDNGSVYSLSCIRWFYCGDAQAVANTVLAMLGLTGISGLGRRRMSKLSPYHRYLIGFCTEYLATLHILVQRNLIGAYPLSIMQAAAALTCRPNGEHWKTASDGELLSEFYAAVVDNACTADRFSLYSVRAEETRVWSNQKNTEPEFRLARRNISNTFMLISDKGPVTQLTRYYTVLFPYQRDTRMAATNIEIPLDTYAALQLFLFLVQNHAAALAGVFLNGNDTVGYDDTLGKSVLVDAVPDVILSTRYNVKQTKVKTAVHTKKLNAPAFPGVAGSICMQGSFHLPFLIGISGRDGMRRMLIPMTKRAVSVLRSIYGIPAPALFAELVPELAGLLDTGARNFSIYVTTLVKNLVYTGLVDIRSYIVGDATGRALNDVPLDEQFHEFLL